MALIDEPLNRDLSSLVDQAFAGYTSLAVQNEQWRDGVFDFMAERVQHLLERRGVKYDEIRAVMPAMKVGLKP